MMEYPIEILRDRLSKLNYIYDKYVINGSIDKESESALLNRKKVLALENAIYVLEEELYKAG